MIRVTYKRGVWVTYKEIEIKRIIDFFVLNLCPQTVALRHSERHHNGM